MPERKAGTIKQMVANYLSNFVIKCSQCSWTFMPARYIYCVEERPIDWNSNRSTNQTKLNTSNKKKAHTRIYLLFFALNRFHFSSSVLVIFCGLLNWSHSIEYWHSKHVIDIYFRFIYRRNKMLKKNRRHRPNGDTYPHIDRVLTMPQLNGLQMKRKCEFSFWFLCNTALWNKGNLITYHIRCMDVVMQIIQNA